MTQSKERIAVARIKRIKSRVVDQGFRLQTGCAVRILAIVRLTKGSTN
jgi:hypothetical protein